MSHVVTLVSNPDRPILTSTLVSRVRDCLPNPAESRWLAEGIAAVMAADEQLSRTEDLADLFLEELNRLWADPEPLTLN